MPTAPTADRSLIINAPDAIRAQGGCWYAPTTKLFEHQNVFGTKGELRSNTHLIAITDWRLDILAITDWRLDILEEAGAWARFESVVKSIQEIPAEDQTVRWDATLIRRDGYLLTGQLKDLMLTPVEETVQRQGARFRELRSYHVVGLCLELWTHHYPVALERILAR